MKKQYIYSEQSSLWGEPECLGFGTDDFYVKEIDRNLAIDIISKNHYSKSYVQNSYIHLGVFVNGDAKGCLQFGYAMRVNSCSTLVTGTTNKEYLELNRMWISDDAGKYPESRAISYSIKYIKRKYPKIKWIQSFADERCGGFGIVYQACSFSYYGEHISPFYELEGEFYHEQAMVNKGNGQRQITKREQYLQDNKEKAKKMELRQFRYIKFLDQREKKKCTLKEQPYPKHYEENVERNK